MIQVFIEELPTGIIMLTFPSLDNHEEDCKDESEVVTTIKSLIGDEEYELTYGSPEW